jgi:hypothetical protein
MSRKGGQTVAYRMGLETCAGLADIADGVPLSTGEGMLSQA